MSDDVIEKAFTIIAATWRALFHALPSPLGVLPDRIADSSAQKRSVFTTGDNFGLWPQSERTPAALFVHADGSVLKTQPNSNRL